MALPLTPPTFYRMPDVTLTGSTIADMLIAISSSLTRLVDYRGTTLPNTHKWTWATGSTSGSISSVYNTAVPASSSMTLNPTIIFAGYSGSAAPTMTSLDTYAQNILLLGVVKNPGAFNKWDVALPMTTGSFTGYQRAARALSNATTTFVRSFISQESVFCAVVETVGSSQNAFWNFAGAVIEPLTSNATTSSAAEADDRIYGINTNGSTANTNTFLTANDGFLYYRGSVFLPTTSSVIQMSKRNNFVAAVNVNNEIDIAGNYFFERIRMIRFSGGTLIANAALGSFHGIYYGGATRSNKVVIRNGSTDLFHLVPYSFTNNSQAIAIRAAP